MAAWTCRASSSFTLLPFLLFFVLGWASRSCSGFGTFGLDFHHRFSDPVTGILGFDELPKKGSPEYYAAMTHRDRFICGRHLAAASGNQTMPLTFVYGNETYRIGAFGHLHYANVSVGTPRTSYLVALDTGSDYLWLPCDCISCVKGFYISDGQHASDCELLDHKGMYLQCFLGKLQVVSLCCSSKFSKCLTKEYTTTPQGWTNIVVDFDTYSPNKSTTCKKVPCNSTYCHERRCSSPSSDCRYSIRYRYPNTSSSGIVVEDVLHLTTDGPKLKSVEAPIAFGCGKNQTGTFLMGAAPNGLLGLGVDDISIPSMLAKQGLLQKECLTFNQPETPFHIRDKYPTYNITVTQIAVGKSVSDLEFSAIWDSGISLTYLNDPAYSQISESFNRAIKDKRIKDYFDLPFKYCYTMSPNQTLNLTLKGGKQYNVIDPLVVLINPNGSVMFFCLGVVKSEDVNIIGQNFMTGYRIIFDREKMVLGWKESDCYNDEETTTLHVSPSKD